MQKLLPPSPPTTGKKNQPHKEDCLNLKLFLFKVIDCYFYQGGNLINSRFYFFTNSCSANGMKVLCLGGNKIDARLQRSLLLVKIC